MKKNRFNLKETVCSCEVCVAMCEHRPCWGTPDEIEKIIDAGFANKLMLDYWVYQSKKEIGDINILCGAIVGYEKGNAPFIPIGRCSFLMKNNRCKLHKLGLKPSEGRVADCKDKKGGNSLHRKVAMTWRTKKATKLVERWLKLVSIKKNNKKEK